MIRFILRKICLLLLIFAFLTWLKQATAPVSDTIGAWVSGAKEHRMTQAFSEMIDAISQGDSIKNSVEVFREALQD